MREEKVEVWRGGKVPSAFLNRHEGFKDIVVSFQERFSGVFANTGEVLCWLAQDMKIPKCLVCGKRIPYVSLKQKRGRVPLFCSKDCLVTEKGRKITHERSVQSLKAKTGLENNFQIHKDSIREKTKTTRFNKALEAVKKKLEENNLELTSEITSFFDENGNRNRFKMRCTVCGTEFEREIRKGNDFGMFCPKCNHLGLSWSAGEREVGNFVKTLVGEDKVVLNTKRVVRGYELDIYVPEKKVAIEYNGLYWHSDYNGKDQNYHLEKTVNCQDNGVRLIQIFEDEWKFKKKIVQSRLKHILGVVPYKLGARNCVVKEVDNSLATKFQEKYHLQGAVPASVKLGLFHKNRLVALMTFAKPRFRKDFDWELVRYCTIGSFAIMGGAGKLLKYFREHHSGSIISYADKRWSDGNLYRQLGFIRKTDTAPTASYFHKDRGYRENYVRYMKHKQRKVLKTYDPDKSTMENMRENGYGRVWDCGNYVFWMPA